MDVAVATCAALPGLHRDDRLLLPALAARGIRAEPVVWEDHYLDWRVPRLCLVRSTWDYSFRRTEFVAWASRVAATTPLWNPAPVVGWNTHKGYLLDLEGRGVAVVPTVLLAAGASARLAGLLGERGWREAVLKPAVGAAGRLAMHVRPERVAEGQAHLDRILPHEDVLLQPYLSSVLEHGELSLVFIDGTFTHAVRKHAGSEEFRVHDDYGGSVTAATPSPAELDAARRAIEAVGQAVLYGRVDLAFDGAGVPRVMELELVEPELFLRFSAEAVDRLAEGVRSRLL